MVPEPAFTGSVGISWMFLRDTWSLLRVPVAEPLPACEPRSGWYPEGIIVRWPLRYPFSKQSQF